MAKKAVLYARVSTVDQEDDGTSLGTQIDACKAFAEKHGYTVVEAVDIGPPVVGLAQIADIMVAEYVRIQPSATPGWGNGGSLPVDT